WTTFGLAAPFVAIALNATEAKAFNVFLKGLGKTGGVAYRFVKNNKLVKWVNGKRAKLKPGEAIKLLRRFRKTLAAPLKVPQGLTEAQFNQAASVIRAKTGHIKGQVVVQGSRAAGTAKATSDIDFAIRVSRKQFDALIKARFGTPNPGSAKFRTM